MLVVGIIPLFAMMMQYSKALKRLGRKESSFSNPIFQMAASILLLGTILLATLLGDIILL
jgi:hypothetical protein